MKPFYQSKKFWMTVAGLVADMIAYYTENPELMAPVTALAAALVVAFGLQDKGKEAAAIEAAAFGKDA